MGGQVPAKIINIFRVTDENDDETTDDRIDFNDLGITNPKDTAEERAFIFTIEKRDTEGIGANLTAEKPDGVIQPLAIIGGTYTITGRITNTQGEANDGNNDFLTLLQEWKDEEQVIKNVWNAGRFGIEDNNDSTNTLIPDNTLNQQVGLIFVDFKKTNNYNTNQSDIVLIFRRSRGLDV